MKKKVIVIVGPTGVGKTKLGIELAKKIDGEIINADAMQVYIGLDIGTAKVTEEEKENIPHHLLDIKKVDEEYTIYHYQSDCRKKIKEIEAKGKIPILVGGTGLYIKSALYDYQLTKNKVDSSKYDHLSTEELYNKLITLDKQSLNKIDKNNRRRVINALIYFEQNKTSITNNHTNTPLYDIIVIGLTTDRKTLYEKINQRVDKMINDGLVEEVKKYYNQKIFTKPLSNGIGYKEIIKYLNNEISYEKAIEEIKKDSRHYAKRQYTFFNHQLPVTWFETNYDNFEETIKEVEEYIKERIE